MRLQFWSHVLNARPEENLLTLEQIELRSLPLSAMMMLQAIYPLVNELPEALKYHCEGSAISYTEKTGVDYLAELTHGLARLCSRTTVFQSLLC